jgi:hypothetical protein
MSNVLNEAKKQQVIALGRLGWPLRCIEQETRVRRETAGAYLAAGRMGTATAGKTGQRECDQRALSVPLVADASALQVSPHELQARKPTAYQVSLLAALALDPNAITCSWRIVISPATDHII